VVPRDKDLLYHRTGLLGTSGTLDMGALRACDRIGRRRKRPPVCVPFSKQIAVMATATKEWIA
jgi:hypothetical protein